MSNLTKHNPGEPAPVLVKALKQLLRPLVRLLLNHGITFPYLCNLLKNLYVEVAESDFPLAGKKQTDSRISLLTGIHRKDTKRLRTQEMSDNEPPENVSIGAQLIAYWIAKPEYLDDQGQPRPLAKKSSGIKHDQPSGDFESLVQSVSKQDLRPRVILDEWLRLGIVHIDEQDRVVLNTEAFIPETHYDEKAYYFGQNLHDHIAAGSHNLLGHTPPFFDRSVYYNCLNQHSVNQLTDLGHELGMEALKKINRKAMQLQDADQNDAKAISRINFGIYFYSEQETPEIDAGNPKQNTQDNRETNK